MAYDINNPPRLVVQDIGNSSGAVWNYRDTDPPATVANNGYITNAKALGIKVGDEIRYLQVTGAGNQTAQQNFRVVTINANGSADLSDGSSVSLANAG